ncbi:MAG: hypothetical protein UR15_C0025G0005 [Parcubacteria group bacterium GW2011_GWA2_31_28]|nr:MAG: hypothetical protein UR15_C0025G0005 [Parcubacteria group bacterium GW2011_GWA2_31_28]
MKITELKIQNTEELLELEEQMYWQSGDWNKLWQDEAKKKFRVFIKDYLTKFPQGCFGLVDDNGNLLGTMFLLKTSKSIPIPYLHNPFDYYDNNGDKAYVSFFVVREGKDQLDIAQKLYDEAEKVALLKLRCGNIVVTIYSSPLEEQILISNNYEKQPQKYEWEIYPSINVESWIYINSLLMKQAL